MRAEKPTLETGKILCIRVRRTRSSQSGELGQTDLAVSKKQCIDPCTYRYPRCIDKHGREKTEACRYVFDGYMTRLWTAANNAVHSPTNIYQVPGTCWCQYHTSYLIPVGMYVRGEYDVFGRLNHDPSPSQRSNCS